ncbi:uncharacterized protein I303_106572 [Kwoniella dejecticola CBS 10117]|uniref:Uncharacterized protein n=1 Tax=Kwoniella dejecticola CBS 10117 TaxID=1296121 RepID=A0A1A5ZUB9_9TREE|nr:uncharacterized protein I303_08171 [Kwoniella dejecticola CBS 10117]OBR81401.1 hypothetical protein I303_08171 [Kwoniella dejecticola CBS 10117]
MGGPASRKIFRRDQSASNSASASTTPFSISDTSPLFSYGSSSSSSTSSPWTAGYAKQSDGYDETLHLTSISNSSIAFNITASSLTLLVPSFENCQATLSINSSSPIPACSSPVSTSSSEVIPFTLYNLPTGMHSVRWDSGIVPNGEQVIFWGIDGTRPIESNGYSNITIDDAFKSVEDVNVGLRFEGDWTHLNPNTHSDALSESGKLDGDFDRTLALTQGKGSAVTFFGSGSAVYIYGTVGPDYGSASVSLNGQMVASSLNLTSPWQMPYELLWFQTGLDASQTNQVVMTNLGDKKMALDFVILTTDAETLSQLASGGSDEFFSSLKGKLILGVAIPVTVLVLLTLLTIWIFRTRRQGSRRGRSNSRESQRNLRPAFASPSSDREKMGGNGNARSDSSRSVISFDDVFVSYDEALQQRLSERWRSPTSPSNSNTPPTATTRSPRSPEGGTGTGTNVSGHTGIGAAMGLTNLPENTTTMTFTTSSPDRVRSLLGSQYAASTAAPDSRRGTALPAYTPEGTYVSQFTPVTVTGGRNDHSPITAYETLTGTTPTNTNPSNGNSIPASSVQSTPAQASTTAPGQGQGQGQNTTRFPTAAEEKAAQLAIFRKFEKDENGGITPTTTVAGAGPGGFTTTSTSTPPQAGPSSTNRHSDTPSDIMSVFGTAPGSEGRLSTLTDWTAATPTTLHHSPFLLLPGSEMDNYPLPLPINTTAPLNLSNGPPRNPKSSFPSGAGAGAGAGHPVRPKVEMTFLDNPDSTSTATQSHSQAKNQPKHSHPFLISPAQIHPSTTTPSTSRIPPPPSSYPTSAIPQTPSTTSEYTQHTEYTTGQAQAQAQAQKHQQQQQQQQQHRRNQSTSSAWTAKSAARPDSAIIPFENFFSGVQRRPTRD